MPKACLISLVVSCLKIKVRGIVMGPVYRTTININ